MTLCPKKKIYNTQAPGWWADIFERASSQPTSQSWLAGWQSLSMAILRGVSWGSLHGRPLLRSAGGGAKGGCGWRRPILAVRQSGLQTTKTAWPASIGTGLASLHVTPRPHVIRAPKSACPPPRPRPHPATPPPPPT